MRAVGEIPGVDIARVHNLMARIYNARGENGPAGDEIKPMEHCKASAEPQ